MYTAFSIIIAFLVIVSIAVTLGLAAKVSELKEDLSEQLTEETLALGNKILESIARSSSSIEERISSLNKDERTHWQNLADTLQQMKATLEVFQQNTEISFKTCNRRTKDAASDIDSIKRTLATYSDIMSQLRVWVDQCLKEEEQRKASQKVNLERAKAIYAVIKSRRAMGDSLSYIAKLLDSTTKELSSILNKGNRLGWPTSLEVPSPENQPTSAPAGQSSDDEAQSPTLLVEEPVAEHSATAPSSEETPVPSASPEGDTTPASDAPASTDTATVPSDSVAGQELPTPESEGRTSAPADR